MGRRPCCSKEGLNRGAWSRREDKILSDYITAHGEGKWRELPKQAGLNRCGKSCRLRWLNYLRPDIKRGNITEDEENLIIKLHALLGNRWSLIAGRLPGRTDNEIKNYWNTNLSKKTMPVRVCKKFYRGREAGDKAAECTSDAVEARPVEQQPAFLVKTKAVRCTKVYIPSAAPVPPPNHEDQLAAAALSSSKTTPAVGREGDHSAAVACSYLEDFSMEELMSGFQTAADDDGDGFLRQLCADVDGVVTPDISAYGDFAQENAAAGGGGRDDDGSLLWFSEDDDGCTESQIAAEVETLASLIDSEEEQRDK